VEPAVAEQSLIGARPAMITPPHRPLRGVRNGAGRVLTRGEDDRLGRRAFRIDPRAAVDDQQIVGRIAAIGDDDDARIDRQDGRTAGGVGRVAAAKVNADVDAPSIR
jgi:hypothetical protein